MEEQRIYSGEGRQARIIHCDVKPENLLVSMDTQSVKLADFGAVRSMEEQRIYSGELQPRYYRAPEVILGQEYTCQIDVWSAGATLFQLAAGYILFEGDSNNGMLYEFLKVCGAFPRAFMLTGRQAAKHFSPDGYFLSATGDGSEASANPPPIPVASFEPPPRPLHGLLAPLLQSPPPGVPLSRHECL